jgi:phosphoglycolate phosphatase
MEGAFRGMKPQLLIFDLDGTLIDSRADLAASINHMRASFGYDPLPKATISSFIGNGVRKLVERSIRSTNIDLDEAMARNKAYYFSHLVEKTTCYPGVKEGIPKLAKAGHMLAVLSNKPGDPTRSILTHFGLSTYFNPIIGGGDIPVLKPDPEGVFHCMQTAKVEASRTWMIGDHCTDLAVAKNAGVRSGFAEYGFGDAKELSFDQKFSTFSQLVDFFISV